MRFKRLICTIVCIALLLLTTISSADSVMRVRLNCLTNNDSFLVDMSEVEPIVVNDRTLVPLRTVCEAAGFKVGWEQSNQTVYVKLMANTSSSAPVERFCARLMDRTQVASLGTAQYIYIEMPVNNMNYAIKYVYKDDDGELIVAGKTAATETPATFGLYGTVMVPLRSVMEAFSLNVGWDGEENLSSVSVPEEAYRPNGIQILASDYQIPSAYITTIADAVDKIINPEPTPVVVNKVFSDLPDNVELGGLIGNFRISHYCPCNICNGNWNGVTAWAGGLIPGQTIAVDPSIIGKLQWVYIEGYGLRRAEDCGGAIKGFKIDMLVDNHSTALSMGIVYRNVYAVTFK